MNQENIIAALIQVIKDARADEEFDASMCDAGGVIFGDVASEAIEAAEAFVSRGGGSSETIIAAAILIDGVMHSMPVPARHHDIMYALDAEYWDKSMPGEQQGFLTSTGRFVKRIEAKDIARQAKQLLDRAVKSSELFSEDVW